VFGQKPKGFSDCDEGDFLLSRNSLVQVLHISRFRRGPGSLTCTTKILVRNDITLASEWEGPWERHATVVR